MGEHTAPRSPAASTLLNPRSAIRAARWSGLAFAAALVAGPSLAQDDPAQTLATLEVAPITEFSLHFAPYATPIAPEPIPPGAVDLSTFEPPRDGTARHLGMGVASYYGRRFHGRLTANGERFNMNAMTAAHKTLPFGSRVRVTNPRNGRSVIVRINDRGPFIAGREIDLSRGAAERIGMIRSGHAPVELELLN